MPYPGNRRPQAPQQPYPPKQETPVVYGADVNEFDTKAEQAFPAVFLMISGCHDSQTSADVSNLNSQFRYEYACFLFCSCFYGFLVCILI